MKSGDLATIPPMMLYINGEPLTPLDKLIKIPKGTVAVCLCICPFHVRQGIFVDQDGKIFIAHFSEMHPIELFTLHENQIERTSCPDQEEIG